MSSYIPDLPHPEQYYTGNFPYRPRYSYMFDREFDGQVQQEIRQGELHKFCPQCKRWKVAATNFYRHQNDGYSYNRGWYYYHCIPCHQRDLVKQRTKASAGQALVQELINQGLLVYDGEEQPIYCRGCHRYEEDLPADFSQKPDGTWYVQCDVCKKYQSRRRVPSKWRMADWSSGARDVPCRSSGLPFTKKLVRD